MKRIAYVAIDCHLNSLSIAVMSDGGRLRVGEVLD
jgi:hypothetical protein